MGTTKCPLMTQIRHSLGIDLDQIAASHRASLSPDTIKVPRYHQSHIDSSVTANSVACEVTRMIPRSESDSAETWLVNLPTSPRQSRIGFLVAIALIVGLGATGAASQSPTRPGDVGISCGWCRFAGYLTCEPGRFSTLADCTPNAA